MKNLHERRKNRQRDPQYAFIDYDLEYGWKAADNQSILNHPSLSFSSLWIFWWPLKKPFYNLWWNAVLITRDWFRKKKSIRTRTSVITSSLIRTTPYSFVFRVSTSRSIVVSHRSSVLYRTLSLTCCATSCEFNRWCVLAEKCRCRFARTYDRGSSATLVNRTPRGRMYRGSCLREWNLRVS